MIRSELPDTRFLLLASLALLSLLTPGVKARHCHRNDDDDDDDDHNGPFNDGDYYDDDCHDGIYLSDAAKIGIGIGIAVLALAGGILFYFLRRRKIQARQDFSNGAKQPPMQPAGWVAGNSNHPPPSQPGAYQPTSYSSPPGPPPSADEKGGNAYGSYNNV